MGERYHHARVCDAALVEELAERAGEAVAARDPAPLESFLGKHGGRRRLIDGHRVPLDGARIAGARAEVARGGRPALAAAAALLEATAGDALPSGPVGKTAQDALVVRLSRLARLVRHRAPDEVVRVEIAYATAAVEALGTADLGARLEAAGLGDVGEVDLVDRALALCAVPGRDGEVGLLEHFVGWEGFVGGAPLVPMPSAPEDPPPDLLARCLERFGEYSVARGCEVHLDDWMRFASSFGYYVPPAWGAGDALRDAALEVARTAAEQDESDGDDDFGESALRPETRRALDLYRAELLRSAAAGHAVVEWIVKL